MFNVGTLHLSEKNRRLCHSVFSQTSERMLSELGFELTNPGVTAPVATVANLMS